ncbi:MAG: pyridoxamine 5'-phosphate oxidase family protein [Acidobacteriia bacterium]|nr:pyridoxamine 5'-phosphate oxidase family protein [Terriglobia bacterium]
MTQARARVSEKQPRSTRPHMPGYGIPKAAKGLLPWTWAEQRLKKSHNYWISTSRPDGSPHTMIVWGLWLDGAFYFSTGKQSRKAKNLANNPKCVISTEHAEQAVIVEGTATPTTEPALLKRFAVLYQKKYKWDMSEFGEPVYVVRPRVAFGLYEKDFMGSATRWRFKT